MGHNARQETPGWLNPEAYVMTVAAHVLHQHALKNAATHQVTSAVDALVDLVLFVLLA
jgi:hypothetical protein